MRRMSLSLSEVIPVCVSVSDCQCLCVYLSVSVYVCLCISVCPLEGGGVSPRQKQPSADGLPAPPPSSSRPCVCVVCVLCVCSNYGHLWGCNPVSITQLLFLNNNYKIYLLVNIVSFNMNSIKYLPIRVLKRFFIYLHPWQSQEDQSSLMEFQTIVTANESWKFCFCKSV